MVNLLLLSVQLFGILQAVWDQLEGLQLLKNIDRLGIDHVNEVLNPDQWNWPPIGLSTEEIRLVPFKAGKLVVYLLNLSDQVFFLVFVDINLLVPPVVDGPENERIDVLIAPPAAVGFSRHPPLP